MKKRRAPDTITIVDCPCGAGQPGTDLAHPDDGGVIIHCTKCPRLVAAASIEEATRMWNAALCNMRDPPP